MRTSILPLFLSMALWLPGVASADIRLVMVEERGCIYCARWTEDVGTEYPLTPEGRFAPLERVNIRDIPEDLQLTSRPVYTPTFVLVDDGHEVGRLEGYHGEEFFWGLLGRLLSQAREDWRESVAE
jgi:thioredoxin-related protein